MVVSTQGGALDRAFEDHVRSSPCYIGAMYVNFVDYCRPMFTSVSKFCSFHVPYLPLYFVCWTNFL